AMDGAGAGAPVVFGVILGTGVGAGIVVERKVLIGRNAIAGEWGHNPLPLPTPDDLPLPHCYCARLGCVETYLSGPGLESDHERLTGEKVSARDIAARNGPALERYIERLARSLAGVINILDPDVEAGELHFAHHHDGGVAPDGGELTVIAVSERDGRALGE